MTMQTKLTSNAPVVIGNPPTFYECGICGSYHSILWDGDCRQDNARFDPYDLDAKYGSNGWTEVPMPGTEEIA